MPIASLVEPHHRLEYADAVQMVAQQRRNPLAAAVTSIPARGEAMSASDLVNAVEYVYGEARSRRNTENPVSGTRRWLIRPDEIKSGQYIDDEDKYDMSRDPTSTFVTAHTGAVLRGRMDRIVGTRKIDGVYQVVDGGILGSAVDGKRPGSSGVALPAGQIIAAGGTGMTVAKCILAVQTLNEADFGLEDDGDQLFCLLPPKGKADLLTIAAASATPLNAFEIQQIKDGKPTTLMGITWIFSNRVPKDASGNWQCPVWAKSNIVEGVWQDIEGDIWNDTSADNKPYCRVRTRADVVRLQDKGVIVISIAP